MRDRVRGPWVVGRLRALLLVAVTLAAMTDVTTFVVLVSRAGSTPVEAGGPDEVARTVIQAVADDDCDGLGELIADGADLPVTVTRCLAGGVGTVALTDVRVVGTTVDGDDSVVTIGAAADGRDAEIDVVLRRDADRWLVTGMRPAGG